MPTISLFSLGFPDPPTILPSVLQPKLESFFRDSAAVAVM
jgi:hypothetical protein